MIFQFEFKSNFFIRRRTTLVSDLIKSQKGEDLGSNKFLKVREILININISGNQQPPLNSDQLQTMTFNLRVQLRSLSNLSLPLRNDQLSTMATILGS